jgi:hypothetical protein
MNQYNQWKAHQMSDWTVNIQLADGRTACLDMLALRNIWIVQAPDSQGRSALAAYFSEDAAKDGVTELLKDSINENARTKDPFHCFNIKRVPLEPLAQMIRKEAEKVPSTKFAGSYMDRHMGEYDLVVNPAGRLYKLPIGQYIPGGWIKINESSLKYEGRLISLLWSLPIAPLPEE